jgi:hypothetical protein
MTTTLIAATSLIAALLGSRTTMQATPQVARSAEELVQALGRFPPELPGGAPSNGALPTLERHRLEIYDRLWSLGPAAQPALCRGLGDRDVQVRRNVALFLAVAGSEWYEPGRPRLTFTECVTALVAALGDSDGRVRALAAQAVPATGAAGAAAVPALIGPLSSSREGDRNSACIGLAGLGPAATPALPALRNALSDPSADVRGFAKRAIERIEGFTLHAPVAVVSPVRISVRIFP